MSELQECPRNEHANVAKQTDMETESAASQEPPRSPFHPCPPTGEPSASSLGADLAYFELHLRRLVRQYVSEVHLCRRVWSC